MISESVNKKEQIQKTDYRVWLDPETGEMLCQHFFWSYKHKRWVPCFRIDPDGEIKNKKGHFSTLPQKLKDVQAGRLNAQSKRTKDRG